MPVPWELIGTVVAPSLIAAGTSMAWFFAVGRKSGAQAEKLNGHLADENVHCAPEHHERLIRIEEQNRSLKGDVDEVKESVRSVHKRIDKALSGHAKRAPAPRRRR